MKATTIGIVTQASGGGVLTHISQITTLLKDYFDFEVVYLRRKDSPSEREIQSLVGEHVRLTSINGGSVIGLIKFLIILVGIFRRRKFDIVHFHSTIAGFIGRIAIRCSCKNAKVLYSPHCFSFLRRDIPPLIRGFFWVAERVAVVLGGELVAVSQFEASVGRTLGYKKLHTITNTVLSERIVDNNEQSETGPIHVVTVGRLTAQKDPDVFLEIVRIMNVNRPVFFQWVGGGPLVEHFEDAIAFYNLEERVSSTGWIDHNGVLEYVSVADVYLHTASWEAQPISILEAMSIGKPVVVRNFPGASELVEHGVNGFLFDSVQEAVKYITYLLDNTRTTKQFSVNSRRIFGEKHSPDTFRSQVSDLYGV